jgi:hypothetical protein
MAGRLAAILARTRYATFLARLDGTVIASNGGAMMAQFYEERRRRGG